jgi:6-phosphogluconate dehydrogenase (decarboxylating)
MCFTLILTLIECFGILWQISLLENLVYDYDAVKVCQMSQFRSWCVNMKSHAFVAVANLDQWILLYDAL